MEEVHIQDHLAHGRSRARVLQVAQFFRAAGISGGVGAADAAIAASTGNATAHQSGQHLHHLQHRYHHQLQARQQPSEGEAQAKAKRLNLRRKHDWI